MTDKRPNYYAGKDGTDVFDAARNFGLDAQATCALKYLVRAGKKTPSPVEDLRKAIVCIERMIEFWEKDVASSKASQERLDKAYDEALEAQKRAIAKMCEGMQNAVCQREVSYQDAGVNND